MKTTLKIGDMCYYSDQDGTIRRRNVNAVNAADRETWTYYGELYGRSLKKAAREIDEAFQQSIDWREKGMSTRQKGFAGMVVLAVVDLLAWGSGGVGMIVGFFLLIFLAPLFAAFLGQFLRGE